MLNVGANAAHRVKSPVWKDLRFELLPIPEVAVPEHPALVRYKDLRSWYRRDEGLAQYLPAGWAERACHLDPDWDQGSYGDIPRRSPRAAALMQAQPADIFLYLARLCPWHRQGFTERAGFFLVGWLQVAEIWRDVRSPRSEASWPEKNAHVRRAEAAPDLWDGFWLFKGSEHTARFARAVPLTRDLAVAVLRDARGAVFDWPQQRTELPTIGMYTRTCRAVLDCRIPAEWGRIAYLLQRIAAYNPELSLTEVLRSCLPQEERV